MSAVPHGFKTLSAACALAMASLCGFSSNAYAAEANDSVLRVGTESSYAPFEFTVDGKLVGFDIDLMNAIAKEMGCEVEWVQMSFDGLIPALLTQQLDMAVASFTVTAERAKRINFSDPYYRSGLTFVIRNQDSEKYPDAKSLEGKRICAQLGSVSAMKAETISPSNVATFNDAAGAYMELMSGGCEAVLNDRPVNQYFLATSKASQNLHELADILDAEDMAMVLPKGDDELLQKVNAAFQALKANGTYQKIYDKWFTFEDKKAE